MKELLAGFNFNIRGLKYLLSHKKLWKFSFIPFLINLLGLILMVSLYLHFFNDIFSFITSPLGSIDIAKPEGILLHMADIALWFVRNLMMVLFFVIALVAIVVVVYFASSLINSPFYEMMAEKILIQEGVRSEVSFSFSNFLKDSMHSIKIEFFKMSFFLSGSLFLFVLSFIPAIGFVFSFIGFVFTSWTFAFGLCVFPLVLKRVSFRSILKWGLSRKLRLIGFGLPALIPFLGMLIMNFQVVGGTLLFIENEQALGSQRSEVS